MAQSSKRFAIPVLVLACGLADGGCGGSVGEDHHGPDGGGNGSSDAAPPGELSGFGNTETLGSGLSTPIAFVRDGDTVFWLEHGSGNTTGKLVRRDPDGTQTSLVTGIAAGGSPLVLMSGELFYVENTGPTTYKLQRIATTGGTPATIATDNFRALTAFDDKLYAGVGGEIRSYTRNGTMKSLVPGSANVDSLAVDGSGLYWTPDAARALMHAPLSGGSATTLATVDSGFSLSLDDGFVYGTSQLESVWKVPKTGGPPVQLALTGTLTAIGNDSSRVYYGDCAAGTVVGISLATGAKQIIDTGYQCPVAIQATASALYVLDRPFNLDPNAAGRLVRIPRADQPPRTDETWCYEGVADHVTGRPAIARTQGAPQHVVYNKDGGGVAYARGAADGTWTRELIDANGAAASHPAIAVGSDGSVQVAYQVANHDLWHARRDPSGAWTRERIAGTGEGGDFLASPSVVIDSAGTVHVFYEESSASSDLKHAWRASGAASWSLESAADSFIGQRGRSPSAVIDHSGALVVAHGGDDVGGLIELRMARKPPGGGWTDTKIGGSLVGKISLDVDAAGDLHVEYRPGSFVMYGHQPAAGGAWNFTSVPTVCSQTGFVDCEASLAVAGSGTAFTTTLPSSAEGLLVQKRDPGASTWTSLQVSLFSGVPALRVDGDTLHVIYARESLNAVSWRLLRHAYRCHY